MEGGKAPYGYPTAPPVHHFYPQPQPPYPAPPPPHPPPPYGHPGPGAVPYGFQSPPPYSSDPAPGYYQGYPPAPPAPCIQPPMPPGGYGLCLYPDLSQLQQPPQVPVTHGGNIYPPVPVTHGGTTSPPVPVTHGGTTYPPVPVTHGGTTSPPVPVTHGGTTSTYPPVPVTHGGTTCPPVPVTHGGTTFPPVPARPAPPLPGYAAPTVPDGGPTTQRCSFAHLKEGEAPPGHVVQWRGGKGLQIFFMQQEGHIVSPKRPLIMSIYVKTCVSGSCEGLVEVHGCWRLRLADRNVPVLHAPPDCYVFMDTSTCPSRIVIVQMPSQLTKRMSEDLLELLTRMGDMRNEEEGVVEKVTTGVATVYDDLTHRLNSAVKGTVPSAHKSTKWLRKGTGSIVRIGGSLVSRGIHFVADYIPANEKPQEECPAHTELLDALQRYKTGLEENSITFVD